MSKAFCCDRCGKYEYNLAHRQVGKSYQDRCGCKYWRWELKLEGHDTVELCSDCKIAILEAILNAEKSNTPDSKCNCEELKDDK